MRRLLPFILTSCLILFSLHVSAQFTDIDGNVYQTVTMGTQVWMKENLKTTKLNDGTAIPNVTDNTAWAALTTPGYCWYNNDAATYKTTYGALYNWYTVNTNKLCPTGWHVPSDKEWTTLTDYLTNNGFGYGGSGTDIGKSMASTSSWTTSSIPGTVGNDQASNNSSGYTGYPGGGRDFNGATLDLGNFAYWWSSTEFGTNMAWDRYLYFQNTDVGKNDVNFTKQDGFSVRCLKNYNSGEYVSDDNTVLLLHLNETSGSVAFDASSKNNNGTIMGGTSVNGKFGFGRQFPTTTDAQNVIITNNSTIEFTGPVTLEAYLKTTGYSQTGTLIIGGNEYSFALGSFGSAGILQFFRKSGNSWYLYTSTNQMPINKWVHLAASWNGSETKMFVDGISIPFTGPIIGAYSSNGINTRIGDFYQCSGAVTADVYIDEVRISNIARSPQEFNILPPTITSATPTFGPVGTTVTITGSGFSTTLANNIVWFGAAKASVTAATSTQLTVTVPSGASYQPITVTVNGLTANSSKPFNLTFNSAQVLNATSFSSKIDFATGSSPIYVAVADFDTDGKPDIATSNQFSNSMSVFRNNSTSGAITSSSFSAKVDFTTGSEPVGIAVGDLDGDGKPDIAIANNVSNTVSVFRNTSTSGAITATSFSTKVDFAVSTHPSGIAIGDIDGDGKPDIAVVNTGSNTISILRNKCVSGTIDANSFAAKADFATDNVPENVIIIDIDGDSKPDVITANYSSNNISVFRNSSTSGVIDNSSFASKVNFPTSGGPYNLAGADLDGDGKNDLAVTNYNANTISVFRNTSTSGSIGSASFAVNADYTVERSECITIGDIDGDGKPDIVATNYNGGMVSVLKNNSTSGTINFASKVDFTTGTMPQGVGICDFDGDGKPDIAVSNSSSSSNTISVYLNTMAAPLLPSATVAGTITQPTCTVSTGSVALSGLPSSGTWTLTRSPGGITTQGTGTTTTITGLASGSYTYTVTDANGGVSTASSSIVINVAPGPAPSTPTAGTIVQATCLAPTGSITINGLPTGNWTLTRTPGGTTNGNTTSTTVTNLAPGTYSFTVTGSSVCPSSALSVTMDAVPIGNVPVIEKKWNSVLFCYNLNNVFSSWQWYKGTELVSTVTTKAYFNTNKFPGTYKVYTTDKDGCKNYSNNIDIVAGAKSISVYPNPANGILTVSMIDESRGKAILEIINASGIKVMQIQTDKSEDNFIKEISVNKLDRGIYTIKLIVDQRDISFTKLVITK